MRLRNSRFITPFLVFLIIVVTILIAWIVAGDDEIKSRISFVIISLVEVFFAFALLTLFLVWWRQRSIVSIFPFRNLIGEKENQERFDAMATGFAELLTSELQRINKVRSSEYVPPEKSTGRTYQTPSLSYLGNPGPDFARERQRLAPPSTITRTDPFGKIGTVSGVDLGSSLAKVGSLSIGPVNLPLGDMLYQVLRIFQGGSITGSFQKFGPRLVITVNYSGKDQNKWILECDCSNAIQDQSVLRDLAEELAFRMIWEKTQTTASDWQSFRELVNALDHYRKYLRRGRADAVALNLAQDSLERAVRLDPHFAYAYHYLGQVYFEKQLFESAIERFKQVTRLKPDLIEAHFYLSLTYAQINDLDNAARECRLAIELAKKQKRQFLRGYTHFSSLFSAYGNKSQHLFENDIRNIELVDPNNLELIHDLHTRIETYYNEAIYQYNEALKAYKQVAKIYKFRIRAQKRLMQESEDEILNLNGEYGNALFETGLIYANLGFMYGEYNRAILDKRIGRKAKRMHRKADRTFKKSLKLLPNDSYTYSRVGRYYALQEQQEKAIDNLSIAFKLDPDNYDMVKGAAEALYLSSDKALNSLLASLKESPTPNLEKINLEIDKIITGLTNAESAGLSALAADSNDIDVWIYLARISASRSSLIASVIENPEFFSLTTDIGTLHQQYFEHIAEMISLLGRAFIIDPQREDIYSGLIDLHALLISEEPGKPSLAEAFFQEALGADVHTEEDPNSEKSSHEYTTMPTDIPSAYRTLAELRKLPEDERDSFLEKVNDMPKDASKRVLLWGLGWLKIYAPSLATKSGLALIEQALDIKKEPFYESFYTDGILGLVYYEIADYKSANRYFASYLDNPSSLISLSEKLEYYRYLADTYRVQNQLNEAIQSHHTALEIYTNNPGDPFVTPTLKAVLLVEQADIFFYLQDYQQALANCLVAVNLEPEYAYPYAVMGDMYLSLYDYDNAIKNYRFVEELIPDAPFPPLYHRIGNALCSKAQGFRDEERRKIIQDAIAEFDKSIALHNIEHVSEFLQVLIDKSNALSQINEFEPARQECQRAMKFITDETDAHILVRLATAMVKCSLYANAENLYKKAINQWEEQLEQANQGDDEIHKVEAAGSLAYALNLLAYYIHAERNIEVEKGIQFVNRALDLLDSIPQDDYYNDNKGAYLDTRAWLYYQKAEYKKATTDLEAALTLTKGTADEHYHLALTYEKMASQVSSEKEKNAYQEKARAQWRYALDFNPPEEYKTTALQRLKENNKLKS
jgi:tetratricopeptide (TPR) repeat protein